mgnify:FL=1
MPYSSFTVSQVEETFNVSFQQGKIFDVIEKISISERLNYSLQDAKLFYLDNEKIKSEAVLFPVMAELMRRNSEYISIFSGKRLDVEPNTNLVGECDFLITAIPHLVRVKAPIIFVIEAKSDNIDYGLAQCSAQMLGTRKFNELEKEFVNPIYGCITTADAWQFMKLEKNIITVHNEKYYLNDLPEILGIFQYIINKNKK